MLLKNEHLVSFVSLKPTYANVMIIIISLSEILHILSKSTKLQFQAFSLMKFQICKLGQLNPNQYFYVADNLRSGVASFLQAFAISCEAV